MDPPRVRTSRTSFGSGSLSRLSLSWLLVRLAVTESALTAYSVRVQSLLAPDSRGMEWTRKCSDRENEII